MRAWTGATRTCRTSSGEKRSGRSQQPAGRRGDPDRDADGVSHEGAARPGGREVPRDRGRSADSEQPGGLRHRAYSEGRRGLMAGKVFFSVSMSLDGFIAPESSEELMGK